MLQGFARSFPFLLARTIIVAAEGAALLFSSIYVHRWFMGFMDDYVEGFFLTMLNPMGVLFGLAIGSVIAKYALGIVKYYFKLAHIIFLTTLILEYKPFRGSRVFFALSEAATNFGSLALNDFTTRTVVKALGALKDAIINTDIMSRIKDSEGIVVKFVRKTLTQGITNVIDMTDEIIVSYTWFTNDLWLADRERRKLKPPSMKMKVKNTANLMLEGMVFTVRVLPQLLINSLIFEVGFIIFANLSVAAILVAAISYFGFSWWYVVYAFILYKVLVKLFYYVIIESLRLTVYLRSFYTELSDLEPFDLKQTLSSLLGKVPLLGPLIKSSGQKIEPSGSEGTPILEGDLNKLVKKNVQDVASAFNLSTDEVFEEKEQPKEEPAKEEEEVDDLEEVDANEEVVEEKEPEVIPEPEVEEVSEIEVEVEVEVDSTDSPFDNVPTRRRR